MVACVAVTVAFTNRAGATAVQISDEPNCALDRLTRVQVNPAPVTVKVCFNDVLVGPADAAKATSSSPAAAVLNAGVVRGPAPSEKTTVSTASGAATAPEDTTSATALPAATCVPATGVWLITRPAATVVLDAVLTAPTASPAAAIVVAAAVGVSPSTLGTAPCTRPEDTTSATALPVATRAPASGVWLITVPAGTVVLDAVVTAPTIK